MRSSGPSCWPRITAAGRSTASSAGYEGLLTFNGVVRLAPENVRGIVHLGGTILGTTNQGNPFRYVVTDADGTRRETDRSDELIAAFRASGFDALIAIGGDGSMQIAWDLAQKGLPVVCVPKTIDNDVDVHPADLRVRYRREHRHRGDRQAALDRREP